MTRAECFVCGHVRPCEMDHVVPVRAGGRRLGTVPLCRGCHDQLDRMPVALWDPSTLLSSLVSVWTKLVPTERLAVLKVTRIAADAMHTSGMTVLHTTKRARRPGPRSKLLAVERELEATIEELGLKTPNTNGRERG